MASYYPSITDEQADLIKNAPLFFVGTAAPTPEDVSDGVGPINISPKGGVPLHILNPNKVAFLNYAGSGNETERHSASGSSITVMICSFEGENAAIVRLYGKAKVAPIDESSLAEQLLATGATEMKLTPRRLLRLKSKRQSPVADTVFL